MNVGEMFRFALWANQQPYEGVNLTVEQVQRHTDLSRAQAYRLLASYFDAKGWCWPREKARATKPKPVGGEHPWRRDTRQSVANAA